jgi:hypothetical protein
MSLPLSLFSEHLLPPSQLLFHQVIMLQLDSVKVLRRPLLIVLDLLLLFLIDAFHYFLRFQSPLHILSEDLLHTLFFLFFVFFLLLSQFLCKLPGLIYFFRILQDRNYLSLLSFIIKKV